MTNALSYLRKSAFPIAKLLCSTQPPACPWKTRFLLNWLRRACPHLHAELAHRPDVCGPEFIRVDRTGACISGCISQNIIALQRCRLRTRQVLSEDIEWSAEPLHRHCDLDLCWVAQVAPHTYVQDSLSCCTSVLLTCCSALPHFCVASIARCCAPHPSQMLGPRPPLSLPPSI